MRELARMISRVEAGQSADDVLSEIGERSSRSALVPHVVGLTGAPGVGKSSAIATLTQEYRRAGKRVAVLAVDPTSPISGGAILGDRVRMQEFAGDEGVFIRSLASRGHLGGVSERSTEMIALLSRMEFDVILVETVGVGQSEVEIAQLVDTTLLFLAPGMGDSVQLVKAGVAEVADIFVVNKADRDGADATVKDIRAMLSLGGRHSEAGVWRPRVVTLVASASDRSESGVDELLRVLGEHREFAASH